MPLWEFPSKKKIHQGNQVSIPLTTEATVIFPYKRGVFDKTYNPESTNHKVSSEQVNEVLTFIDKTVKDRLACVSAFSVLLLLVIIATFAALFWKYHNTNTQSYILAGTFVIGVPLICLMAAFRHKRLNQARALVKQNLDLQNQSLASAGVRWALPAHFPMWIELHNDFKNLSSSPLMQAITVHPAGTTSKVEFQQTQIQLQNASPKSTYKPPQQFNQQEEFEI